MKLNTLLALGLALIAAGCAEKEEALPDEAPVTEMPAAEMPAAPDQAFLAHMHKHAEQLDALNFALADEDLEAARTPAYWLSRHESVDGVDAELNEFLYGMRIAAEAVEVAPDLATARAAAEQINAACQGCHDASGVEGG